MVQDIECFQSEGCIEALVDGENTGNLGIEIEQLWPTERVPADVPIGSRRRAAGSGVVGADLGKGRGIEVSAVCYAGAFLELHLSVTVGCGRRGATVIATVGQRVVSSC